MTNLTLAGYANLALYAAMTVLALAMIAFSGQLAVSLSARGSRAREDQPLTPAKEPVGAHVGAGAGVPPGQTGVLDRVPETGASPPGEQAVSSPVGRWGTTAMSLSWLGTMLLTLSVALRGLSVSRPPLGNMFEFSTFAALLVMVVYLAMSLHWPLHWLGLFVVLPVLLTLGLALSVWYTAAAELLPSLKSVWLVIHVAVAVLSIALFTLAASVLVLHLLKSRQERLDREAQQALREGLDGGEGTGQAPALTSGGVAWRRFLALLPSARTLDRISYGLHVVAFPLLTFTVIAGAIWAQQAWGSYWNWDPKEVWTFIVWVIYAAYLHARATSGWSARTANILALAGYAAIIVNFTVVNLYFPGQHSYSGVS